MRCGHELPHRLDAIGIGVATDDDAQYGTFIGRCRSHLDHQQRIDVGGGTAQRLHELLGVLTLIFGGRRIQQRAQRSLAVQYRFPEVASLVLVHLVHGLLP
jgi:hypothetical protein